MPSLIASSFLLQISGLSATFAEIFLEIIQSNLPEGVRLSVKEVGACLRRGSLVAHLCSKYRENLDYLALEITEMWII